MEHQLRSFGQTRRCCIKNYYTSNGKVEEKKNNTAQDKESRIDIVHIHNLTFCLPAELQQDLRDFLVDEESYFRWESYNGEEGNFLIEDFSGNLFYPHCDYRGKIDYNKGTTDSDYLQSGLAVLQQKTKKNRDAAIKQNNGIYGVWPYVHLNYSDYQKHAHFGAMHAISGTCKLFFKYISGSRGNEMSKNMKKYLKNRNLHPYATAAGHEELPWKLSFKDETRFDCILACCLRPIGMHEEKSPKNMFQRQGNLKCAEVINIFAYFLPYMVSEVGDHFGSSYKAFLCMLSGNVRSLIAHSMTAAQATSLQKR